MIIEMRNLLADTDGICRVSKVPLDHLYGRELQPVMTMSCSTGGIGGIGCPSESMSVGGKGGGSEPCEEVGLQARRAVDMIARQPF